MPNKIPQLLEWHINLDAGVTDALRRAANNNTAAGQQRLVENDLLDLRLRFYRNTTSGGMQQIRLDTPWRIGLCGKDATDIDSGDLFRSDSFAEAYADVQLDFLKAVTVTASGSSLTIVGTGFLDNGTPTHVTLSGMTSLAEYNGAAYEVVSVNSTTIIVNAAGTTGTDSATMESIARSDYYYSDLLDLETTPLATLLSGVDEAPVLTTIELSDGNPSTRRRTIVRNAMTILPDTYDEDEAAPDDLIEVIDGGNPSNAGLLSGVDGGTL